MKTKFLNPIILAAISICALALFLTGCSSSSPHAGQTYYGIIESVDGQKATLSLGTIGDLPDGSLLDPDATEDAAADESASLDGTASLSSEEQAEIEAELGAAIAARGGIDAAAEAGIQDLESMSENEVHELESASSSSVGDGANGVGGSGASDSGNDLAPSGNEGDGDGTATMPGVSLADRGLEPAMEGARTVDGTASGDDADQAPLMEFTKGADSLEVEFADVPVFYGVYLDGAVNAVESATDSAIHVGAMVAVEYDDAGKLVHIVLLTNVL